MTADDHADEPAARPQLVALAKALLAQRREHRGEGGEEFDRGVRTLAAAIATTLDEDGDDIDGKSIMRIGALLAAVRRGDPQDTWGKYAAPGPGDCCECGEPMTDPPEACASQDPGVCYPRDPLCTA